jgi:argininosuccinate lyase
VVELDPPTAQPAQTAPAQTLPAQTLPAKTLPAQTLWHGRFALGPAEALQALNDSLPFDQRMYREDIAGSRAHVRMLTDVGLLNADELSAILAALDQVEAEIESGAMVWQPTDEDIHTAVERRVTELAPAGAKMHTGRSRNDQVATDVRLITRRELSDTIVLVLRFQKVLLAKADEAIANDWYLPGYTHMQRAQPVMLGHHFLAHCWALARDVDRLLDAYRRTDVSVLGAGALAGSSLPLDPTITAGYLGFADVFDNSLDAVADRDFVADALYAMSMLGVHLSRIGEELILWATDEFGFVGLDDAFSTGSSMMPQKKNPDIAELARGKAGRLIGHLTGFLASVKGLPLTYNKDMQEDKEPLFDAFDTVRLTLLALDGMVSTLVIRGDVMAAAADSPYSAATDLAEWLVSNGMPFRAAHAVVGELVRRALAGEASLRDLVVASEHLGDEPAAILEPGAAVRRRSTRGSGGPGPVAEQRERFVARLNADIERLNVADAGRLAAAQPGGE